MILQTYFEGMKKKQCQRVSCAAEKYQYERMENCICQSILCLQQTYLIY